MSKWISVKDRLPAEEEDVLVLIKETEHYGKHREKINVIYWIHTGWFIDGRWATTYCFGHNFVDDEMEEGRGTNILEVTHWKPLPKLPKSLRK